MTTGAGFLRRNGLALVLVACFLVPLAGQVVTGHAAYNEERRGQGAPELPLGTYLTSGHLVSAVFENWESEFLQMGMYVLLTVALRQKGSAESRPLDPRQEQPRVDPGPMPWPVRVGGAWRWLYAHSLSIAFGLLFLLSFALHLLGSWRHELDDRLVEGMPPVALLEYARGAEFWFESFQNWQSEFLAVLSLVVLSIWLREEDSPQSKPVRAPHAQTGD